jgi:molybdopterin molybdotransferase
MPEFLELLPPLEALEKLLRHIHLKARFEVIKTEQALGRVTALPVIAPHSLPPFPRSTVDGFAVRASDTFGASESLPIYLRVVGEVPMGTEPSFELDGADCALIHTGGMLPIGADAVVMVENTQGVGDDEVEILRAVAIGENMIQKGEDVSINEEVIPIGKTIRPAEIGGLMALGILKLQVVKQPFVGIISSGDEVVAPGCEIKIGQVRDVNSYSLSALIQNSGGIPKRYGIVSDQMDSLREVVERALKEMDLVVITAGSSASTRDLTSQVINELGEPGVLVHGVNVRPGKPTILGVCKDIPVIGLPGNPVSALVIASLFVKPVVEYIVGVTNKIQTPSIPAKISLNLASQSGREDWVAVKLIPEPKGYIAEPIFGKSNLIFTLSRADGLIRIPPDKTGLDTGEMVDVIVL